MPSQPGTRLGPYEIQSLIGAGGMGEVYKARDTRLGRIVAVKILPDALAGDPGFRARFEREARTISHLEHPHICALYDVGEESGRAFFVMQYLEGTTLCERLKSGPLPLDQALAYAVQIADALGAAHRAGIVHRDLKPANIFLTQAGAKLLDFGLAKTGANITEPEGGSRLPTTLRGLTTEGAILGTFQYMAPEQLEGKEADARTDIFALGAVLHETVSGCRAFEGGSRASLIAAIMQNDPPAISTLRPLAPPILDHVVSRCLAKERDERWQTASDLMRELKWVAEQGPEPPAGAGVAASQKLRSWRLAACLVSLVAVVLALVVAYLALERASRQGEVGTRVLPILVSVRPPENTHLTGVQFALSPDGTRLAFVVLAGQARQLWLYSLASGESHAIAGADDVHFPFWSPDGQHIGFLTERGLVRVRSDGGPTQNLAPASDDSSGAWNDRGVVLFAGKDEPGIYRVASSGGSPTPVTTPDLTRDELEHKHPRFLPGGTRFLYFVRSRRVEYTGVYVRSLDANDSKLLIHAPTHAEYVVPGYLLFVRDSVLFAQRLDLSRLELEGDPLAVTQGVSVNTDNGGSALSVSRDGSLAYHAGDVEQGELRWVDRRGNPRTLPGTRALFRGVELSPDGRKVLVKIRGTQMTLTGDLWTIDLARGITSRLTFGAESLNARWSPDGRHVFFDSRREEAGIYRKRSDGTGVEELVWKTRGRLADVSNDGRLLVEEGRTCAVVSLVGQPTATTVIESPLAIGCGRFTLDGRFLAYTQNELGRSQVYVVPFPEGRPRVQVSRDNGLEPRWRKDGRELFFLSPAGAMMSVKVAYTPSFQAAPPTELFRTGALTSGPFPQYSVTSDGQRFLMIDPVADGRGESLAVIAHWSESLKR
jgi:eukaryotic-like serine/threonine-protein kinase